MIREGGVRRADRSTLLAPRERNPREKTHSPLLFSLRTPLHFPHLCARWNASRSCAIHSRNLSSQPTTLSTGNRNAIVRDTAGFSGKFNKSFFRFFFDTNTRAIERGRNFFPLFLSLPFFPFLFLRARVLCASILQRSGSKAFFDRLLRDFFLTRVMLTRNFMTRYLIVSRRANTKYFISLKLVSILPFLSYPCNNQLNLFREEN